MEMNSRKLYNMPDTFIEKEKRNSSLRGQVMFNISVKSSSSNFKINWLEKETNVSKSFA